jgi:hypothetical protein
MRYGEGGAVNAMRYGDSDTGHVGYELHHVVNGVPHVGEYARHIGANSYGQGPTSVGEYARHIGASADYSMTTGPYAARWNGSFNRGGPIVAGAEVVFHHQKRFYNHLRMHPSYYANACAVAKRLAANDPSAIEAMKAVLVKANLGDQSAINTAKAVGVVMKFEHMAGSKGPYGLSVSGLLPAAGSAAGKFVRLVLSPVAWALGTSGQLAHWTGNQFGKLSRAL